MKSTLRLDRRTKVTWARALAGLAIAVSPLRCANTTAGDSGSQTHWFDVCASDAECRRGLTCECGLCTRRCSSEEACSDPTRPAVCVSGAALCAESPAPKLCLPACSAGCLRGETCTGGACVPSTVLGAGASGTGGGISSAGGSSPGGAGNGGASGGSAGRGAQGGGAGEGGRGGGGAGGAAGGGVVDGGPDRDVGVGGDANAPGCGPRPFTIADGVDCTAKADCPGTSVCDPACVPSGCSCFGSTWSCTSDCRHACSDGGFIVKEPPSLLTATSDYVWLVGWSGGLNHYSWLKFTPAGPGADHGALTMLDAECVGCVGYFPCQGTDGTYSMTRGRDAGASQLVISHSPSSCGNAPPVSETWPIGTFVHPGGWTPRALWELRVDVENGLPISAAGYPRTQCDIGFTSCAPL